MVQSDKFHKIILCFRSLTQYGNRISKQRLYGEVLNGTRFGNALAEFKTKTSTHKQTNIRPYENGHLIQGEKFYCTGSLFAHRIPTLVLDDAGREYLAFVKSGSQGLKLVDDWSGFGQKTTGSGTVKFDQVLSMQMMLFLLILHFTTNLSGSFCANYACID